MKRPNFTDAHRFPHGYVPSKSTDIAATFRRARRQIEAEAQRQAEQLATERERADYAWRNTRTIEAARQEEMRRRDELEFELHTLRILAQASLDARDKEVKAAMSEADRRLREALATPNVQVEGAAGCLQPEAPSRTGG